MIAFVVSLGGGQVVRDEQYWQIVNKLTDLLLRGGNPEGKPPQQQPPQQQPQGHRGGAGRGKSRRDRARKEAAKLLTSSLFRDLGGGAVTHVAHSDGHVGSGTAGGERERVPFVGLQDTRVQLQLSHPPQVG